MVDELPLPIELKYVKEIKEYQMDVFPECNTKMTKIGFFKVRRLFVHKYKDRWEVLELPCLKRYVFRDDKDSNEEDSNEV